MPNILYPREDPVSVLYPGTRIPDGQDERGATRIAAGLDTTVKLHAELDAQNAYHAENQPAIVAEHRQNLAAMMAPRFETRVLPTPVTDTIPTVWQPPRGVGWIVAGIAMIPPIDSAFGTLPTFAWRIEGFDEQHELYLRAPLTPEQVRVAFRCTLSMQIGITVIASAAFPPTLVQQPALIFQCENWMTGAPFGD